MLPSGRNVAPKGYSSALVDDDDANALALGRVELHRLVRQLLAREPLGRHRNAIFKGDFLLAECGYGRKRDNDQKDFHSSTLFHFVVAKIRSSLPWL
jgi:hypothetical protein